TDVAVGIERLASMFSTIFAATPRRGVAAAPSGTAAAAGRGAAGRGASVFGVAGLGGAEGVGAGVARAPAAPSPAGAGGGVGGATGAGASAWAAGAATPWKSGPGSKSAKNSRQLALTEPGFSRYWA